MSITKYRHLTPNDAHRYLTGHGHTTEIADYVIHWETSLGYTLTIDRLRDYTHAHFTVVDAPTEENVTEWVDDLVQPGTKARQGRQWIIADRSGALAQVGHAIIHKSGSVTGQTEWLLARRHRPTPPRHLRNAATA